MQCTIIDGYIDEPTCLGVPFFLSTYVRYCAGAALAAGADEIRYLTIEALRADAFRLPENGCAVLIAGNPVPGKYLGGLPIKRSEFRLVGETNPDISVYVGGPLDGLPADCPANMQYVAGDIEHFLYTLLKEGREAGGWRSPEEVAEFSRLGAFIVRQHPRFPDIIAEIESGRGCPRRQHCSFCVEGRYPVRFRSSESIIAEVSALYEAGIRHFRLSKQADLLSYQARLERIERGFPEPVPEALEKLYAGIRQAAPELETLHLDNINPGTIARYPRLSERILHTIAEANTPGDTAALGMESADPAVIAANNLKADPEEIRFAVELINSIGGSRVDGIPKLLPGINLIKGLPGETRDTFRLNYAFLKSLLPKDSPDQDSGPQTLLRRINIRQLTVNAGTEAASQMRASGKTGKKLEAAFRHYRKKIRDEVDIPMLRHVFPIGTLFSGLIIEQHRGDWSLARHLGTYPVVVNIPGHFPPYAKMDAFVIGHRERSLVGLPAPFVLAEASAHQLKQLPGFHKQAGALFARGNIRPEDLRASPIFDVIAPFLR